ncbi:hypothetical protein CDAR_446581 [Caerostris darwini]|uniref:Ycf15 n=1 Tax=Caerostris darwini TaxID=1538125 RepID=A0AAV4PPA5_9ARAC|nr:hypothetical protein CDAR_446581 [Caerostris darwini]
MDAYTIIHSQDTFRDLFIIQAPRSRQGQSEQTIKQTRPLTTVSLFPIHHRRLHTTQDSRSSNHPSRTMSLMQLTYATVDTKRRPIGIHSS